MLVLSARDLGCITDFGSVHRLLHFLGTALRMTKVRRIPSGIRMYITNRRHACLRDFRSLGGNRPTSGLPPKNTRHSDQGHLHGCNIPIWHQRSIATSCISARASMRWPSMCRDLKCRRSVPMWNGLDWTYYSHFKCIL